MTTDVHPSVDVAPDTPRRTRRHFFPRIFLRDKDTVDPPDGQRWPFFGNAARIHALEARERYWILRREIESHIDACARQVSVPNWRYRGEAGWTVDRHIARVERDFRAKIAAAVQAGHCSADKADQFPQLLNYYKILLKDRSRLTRKYPDLNLLWRDMNFIRTRLLSDHLIPTARVPHQLDFCRIEARNLGLIDDSEFKILLEQAAEELDVSGAIASRAANKARRLIISLMVKLNDFRIRQIYEQIYKRRMYIALCVTLLTLSVVLFELAPDVLGIPALTENAVATAQDGAVPLAAPLQAETGLRTAHALHSWADIFAEPPWRGVLLAGQNAYWWCIDKIALNPLIFIFFAGFAGGIFSAMMRFEPLKKLPGDEIYIFWYRITKPVIGAFGAMVLFIIIFSPALGDGVQAIVSKEIVDSLQRDPLSATGFAFGFLTGFTERIVLPTLK